MPKLTSQQAFTMSISLFFFLGTIQIRIHYKLNRQKHIPSIYNLVYSKTCYSLTESILTDIFTNSTDAKIKNFNFIVQQDAPEVSEESPDPVWPAPTEKLQRLVPLVHGDKARI